MEVWGAEGGTVSGCTPEIYKGGKGGYSVGNKSIDMGNIIYLVVGSKGADSNANHVDVSGGYNGGGNVIKNVTVNHFCAGGGGASHIATKDRGILSNYANYKLEILIVAGGGGGGLDFSGTPGDGGGESGTQGTLTNSQGTSNSGGISVMNSGDGPNIIAVNGSFGQGGYAVGTWHNNADAGGCGGGGWYGGGGISTAGCGGGGSGHINTDLIESGKMETGVRQGYGYILITQIRHN